MENENYTVREVAECKRISTQRVYALLNAGKLKYIRVGEGPILIPHSELRKVMGRAGAK